MTTNDNPMTKDDILAVGGEAAFPTLSTWEEGDPAHRWIDGGLTKRELFAAMAMQGILTGLAPEMNEIKERDDWDMGALADMSAKISDALLAELAKEAK